MNERLKLDAPSSHGIDERLTAIGHIGFTVVSEDWDLSFHSGPLCEIRRLKSITQQEGCKELKSLRVKISQEYA